MEGRSTIPPFATNLSNLRIPTPDGTADAFAAFPDDGARHPGVLLYGDAFGDRPVLRSMAAELAGHGYYVLVPDFLYRHGPAPLLDLPEFIDEKARHTALEKLMPLLHGHSGERILRDADAFLDFLTEQPEAADGPVGVLGYCFGGLLAVRTAAARPGQVAALAGFHCPVVPDASESLHDLLSWISAEVYLGHAASDLTPEALDELNGALDGAGLRHLSEIHPDTVHGFTMADTDAFSADGLRRHWERLVPLLDRNLPQK
ncbi:dienelactone hydrolase family protein [Streptomyces sp. NPDC052225]|uniref:dienelactone hydrolase family protein n=1 Tax=Streptomyces sp. NPDC052225 TaxID=3154949 RepID=UPI00343F3F8D